MSQGQAQVKQDFFPLTGGLDLVTPSIEISPGKIIDSQNYEPAIGGGYRRIDGYERFDGQASPSGANYVVLPVSITGTILVGDQITGNSSGATAYVLSIVGATLICGRTVGTFTVSEIVKDGGVTVATVTASQVTNGAATLSLNNDYLLLAANDLRTLIQKVPGSGKIRGVWIYNDILYAFRDNVGATAGAMYKQSAGGWVLVTFGREIQFTTGTAIINVGDTITGGTSGATAPVVAVLLRTGAWSGTAVGTLIIGAVVGGPFQNAEALKVGGVSKATSSSVDTAISRTVGGTMEFFNYNFTGSTNSLKMYGVDGVNLAFEFDGTNYIPIRTGMTTDTPSHVICHKGYLVLSFLGSIQLSALSAPYSWTVVLGATEIDTGDSVSGFLVQGGTSAGTSLAIFTEKRTYILYGTSATDFKLVTSQFDVGYSPFTMQQVSNNAFGMTGRGIQSLITTLQYGDFDYASISHEIQPLITAKRGLEISSTAIKTKNQYRVYFSDNTALAVGLTGDSVNGMTVLNYGKPVRCIVTATLTTGKEVTYFGSDDGYVYQDNIGTSQDGANIEAWCRLPFNNMKSPRVLKFFRRAVLETIVDNFSQVTIGYDLGYGDPNISPPSTQPNQMLVGMGGYWDQVTWDNFNWDAAYRSNPSISLTGTATNIGLLFYTNRAQDQSHTLQGVTIIYSPRRLSRE